MGDLIYEPRSFWSVATVPVVAEPRDLIVQMPREHFRNGTPHPIQIDRVAIAGINYTLRETDDAAALLASTFRNAASAINFCSIRLTVPRRQKYNRERIPLHQLTPQPRGEPAMRMLPTGGAQAPYASGLFGLSVLRFDRPLMLPQRGSIELGLSAITYPDLLFDNVLADDWPATRPKVSILFQEEGGLLPGSVRAVVARDTAVLLGETDYDPEASPPYPPDGFGFSPNVPGTVGIVWGADSRINTRDFDQQESTRGGSTKFVGARVLVDQIDYDDAIQAGPDAAAAGEPVCPISLRMGARVRTTNAGTKTWWWRPGCPLGLCFDTVTPANVYKLPIPITLEPGDLLTVELEVPAGVSGGSPVALQPTRYNIGVSFNGFATIEG